MLGIWRPCCSCRKVSHFKGRGSRNKYEMSCLGLQNSYFKDIVLRDKYERYIILSAPALPAYRTAFLMGQAHERYIFLLNIKKKFSRDFPFEHQSVKPFPTLLAFLKEFPIFHTISHCFLTYANCLEKNVIT